MTDREKIVSLAKECGVPKSLITDAGESLFHFYQLAFDNGVKEDREEWIRLRDRIQSDINRPDGRWGIHGREAVDDDYFCALEWVVNEMIDVLEIKYLGG